MLIVADTSPLNLLVQVNQAQILADLFERIILPHQVAEELRHPHAPPAVRAFMSTPPSWLVIQSPGNLLDIADLDLGERAAISLALELDADVLLVDERAARLRAAERGLRVLGAVGVLERAADTGLIHDLGAVHAAIRNTNFHVSSHVLDRSLRDHQARKSNPALRPNRPDHRE